MQEQKAAERRCGGNLTWFKRGAIGGVTKQVDMPGQFPRKQNSHLMQYFLLYHKELTWRCPRANDGGLNLSWPFRGFCPDGERICGLGFQLGDVEVSLFGLQLLFY